MIVRDDTLTQRLRDIGGRWQTDTRSAGDETKALYLPLLQQAQKNGVEVLRNIMYGTHERHILDIYRPLGATAAPVIAFAHGGAFVRGAKDINSEMYGNVLTWFARQGFIGVNLEYRLAPEASFPGGALDLAQACAWVTSSISRFGGNPERLCLIGHSAGGTHVGTLIADSDLGFGSANTPRCAVLISARLRADSLPINPNASGVEAYFGVDSEKYEALSPIYKAGSINIPVLVVNAEYENPLLDLYGLEFALAVGRAKGVAPPHITLIDHNHVSIMAHFNTTEQYLGEQIVSFFERCV